MMREKFIIFFCFLFSVQIVCGQSFFNKLKHAFASKAYQASDYENAFHCYEQLMIGDPSDKNAVRGIADCLYNKKNFDDAENYYKQLLFRLDNSDQEQEEFYFNYGCAQSQQKKYKEALESFERVVKIDTHNDRAKKNIEILKKLLEEQNNDQTPDDKDQKKDSDQNNDDKQGDKQEKNQNDQDQNDRADNKDQSDSKKSENEDQDQRQNNDHDKSDQKDSRENDHKDDNQRQSDQRQPQQNENGQPQDEQGGDKKDEGEQQGVQHETSPEKKQSESQESAQGDEQQLSPQMYAILQQANDLEKHGQQLYMQALSGQQNEAGSDHAW